MVGCVTRLIRKQELAHIWPRLLPQVADGHWHTRASIAHGLGVAPERLRAALHQFLRMGAPMQCDVYRGLRFVQPVTALRGEGRREACSVEESFAVDSTNTQAMQALGAGLARRKAWVAEYQTFGRGRAQRRWHQGLGCGLSLSLAFPVGEVMSLQALPLRVGLALAEALQALGVRDVGLKWPNDVLVQGKKLAGILLEARPAGVVVGVGLNHLRQRYEEQAITQPTTSLQAILGCRLPVRSRVLYEVLRAVLREMERVSATWQSRYARLDVLKNKPVRVLEVGGAHWLGTAQGIDEQGYLRVMTLAGMRLCHAGEVSVRLD